MMNRQVLAGNEGLAETTVVKTAKARNDDESQLLYRPDGRDDQLLALATGFEAKEADDPTRSRSSTPTASSADVTGYASSLSSSSMTREEEFQLKRQKAISMIRRWAQARARKRIFRRLKQTIMRAESLMATELLRQLCPAQEAHILDDPVLTPRVRLRFGGTTFPPEVFYKVFLGTESCKVSNLSSSKAIAPASKAAMDACRVMGRKRFMEQVVTDYAIHNITGMTDELDVTSTREYMKLQAIRDDKPAELGGRSNYWRSLTSNENLASGRVLELVQFVHEGGRRPMTFSLSSHCILPPISKEQAQLAASRARIAQAALNKKTSTRRSPRNRNDRLRAWKATYGLRGQSVESSPDLASDAAPSPIPQMAPLIVADHGNNVLASPDENGSAAAEGVFEVDQTSRESSMLPQMAEQFSFLEHEDEEVTDEVAAQSSPPRRLNSDVGDSDEQELLAWAADLDIGDNQDLGLDV